MERLEVVTLLVQFFIRYNERVTWQDPQKLLKQIGIAASVVSTVFL